MNKRSIKLLIVAGIVSAVNLNVSYCMEEKDKNEYKTEVKNETELHKVLGMEHPFYIMKDNLYYDEDRFDFFHTEIAQKFYNILFDKNNDYRNLNTILSSNCKWELRCINWMLHDTKLYNYLKTLLINYNDSLLKNISNIVNTIDPNISNEYTIEIKDQIKSLIEDTRLLKKLGMKYSFREIINEYWRKCSNYDKYARQKSRNEIAEKFCNILFRKKNDHLNNDNLDNNDLNLKTILTSDSKYELIEIFALLYYVKEVGNHLKKLLISDNSLLDNVLKIVNTPDTKISNKDILDITNKIKDKIRSLIEDVKF